MRKFSMCTHVDLLKNIEYQDQFGHEPIWNCAINEVLESIKEKDAGWLSREIGRAKHPRQPKQRGDFLAECWAAYYFLFWPKHER